jgi:hypothetical protein
MKEPVTSSTMSKRLSFTPSPDEGSKSKGVVAGGSHGRKKTTPKSAGVKRRSPTGKGKSPTSVGRSATFRNNTGVLVPKVIKFVIIW